MPRVSAETLELVMVNFRAGRNVNAELYKLATDYRRHKGVAEQFARRREVTSVDLRAAEAFFSEHPHLLTDELKRALVITPSKNPA